MKQASRFTSWLLIGLLVGQLGMVATPKKVHADTNLIANPSLELANAASTAPQGWQTDQWGNNTASLAYVNDGYNSSRSVRVSMSNFTSGDAKWFFDPVVVSASTSYTFSEYYKSSLTTHIVAMSYDVNNKVSYYDVDVAVPASSAWKSYNKTFKTKASSKKITLLHLVEGNGWLQTDTVSLSSGATPVPVPTPTPTPTPVPTPDSSNPVANPSVETANGSVPVGWSTSSWGTNSPTYQYVNGDGHAGSRSVKVAMGSYTDGDAKWMPNPVALTAGKDYRFTAWYKTNTVPHVVANYIKSDGAEDFFGLPDPQPAANASTTWQQYSDTFNVPTGTKSVSLFFFLSNSGWVQTDDYSISPYVYTGFNRPLVTLTFDDGFEENITNALPVLNQYGFKSTQCYATQYIEGLADQVANVKKFSEAGHEVCAHSVTHPWFTQLTTTQMDYELQHSRDFLHSITGQQVTDFASPYGDYNSVVNNEIAKYFTSHRTTDEGYNSKDNYNPYRLRVQNMSPTTTLAQFQAWVNKAKADRTWLILVYHKIDTVNLDAFDTKTPDFKAQMAWLAGSGVTVKTWRDARAEIGLQL